MLDFDSNRSRTVGSFTTLNLQGRYTGFEGLTIAVGIDNALDELGDLRERLRSHGLSVDFEPSHGKMGILVKETGEQAHAQGEHEPQQQQDQPTRADLALELIRVVENAAIASAKASFSEQSVIFQRRHNWIMCWLYTGTFGSFIGFSMALPLSITVIFGFQHVPDASGVMTHTLKNPNAPSALTYAWIGPFVGALIRPIGGWISDRVGGSIVTQIISVVMVVCAAATGYVMMQAYNSATPEQYFFTFLILFIVLFAATVANGE